VPASYLKHCEFGGHEFDTTADLEDAYVDAALCAKRGNDDKARIRDLTNTED